jgi:hypothetical protein
MRILLFTKMENATLKFEKSQLKQENIDLANELKDMEQQ